MSAPTKSPVPKSQSKKKKVNVNSLMLPGLDKLPKQKGGKPVVVVVVKGGKKPPNLSNLPFLMGAKIKKKKSGKNKKSTAKSAEKKKSNRTNEDDSELSDSDRVSAPELPKAHTKKGDTSTSIRSDKSVTGISSSTSTSNISSMSNAPVSRTPQLSGRSSKRVPPPSITMAPDPVVIQDGIVDRPCVPQFLLIDGPAGCPIIIPLDARDGSGLVSEGSPPPLRIVPSQDTKGYMVVEDGLLHFKPLKDCPQPPPSSTLGTLSKFLTNSNIFVADAGPQLPEAKEINTAANATIKEKIGVKLAVSGHITILADKGTCKFTRVSAVTKPPFYPENAAMGVLVKDRSTSHLFWIPTENRFVGPLLSQNIKIPVKKAKEMAIMGNVYKDSNGLITFEAPSNKLDNLIGFIMSSATGVPIYAAKPEGVASTTRPTPSSDPIVSPTASAPPPPPPPSAQSPPARDEISPPPVISSPFPLPAAVSPSPSAASAAPVEPAPSVPTGPSLGWSLLSTLGSVLSTTASVISSTAGAVTEAAAGAGASLPPLNQSPPPTAPVAAQAATPPPPAAPSPQPVVVPAAVSTPVVAAVAAPPTPAKVAVASKPAKKSTPVKESAPPPTDAANEEAALAAEEANAARAADAASTGGATGVTINITVRDSNSNGGKISDQKSATDRSDGESFSDANSEGGIQIGDQMASIYRNLLSSQNELPPDPEPQQKEEESKNEERMDRKARSSLSEENRRKAETTKEYKKYMDDRSVSFSPYGYR